MAYYRRSQPLVVTHPHLVVEWHPILNGVLSPHDITAGSRKRVWWKCYAGTWPNGAVADDHEWEAVVGNRALHGSRCPFCNGDKVSLSNCLVTTHPQLVSEWDWIKNRDFTPCTVGAGSYQKVWWKCLQGKWPNGTVADDHEWVVRIRDRANLKTGCPFCSGNKVVPSTSLATTHPDLVTEWHSIKNFELKATQISRGSCRKVWWKCQKCNHEWQALIYNRALIGTGCPRCQKSKGEIKIADYLDAHNIPYKSQWPRRIVAQLPKRFKFDFAVNRDGVFWLIEYHGHHHYAPVNFGSRRVKHKFHLFIDVIRRDTIKEQWCHKRKKKLLVISYWNFARIGDILDDFFGGKDPKISESPPLVRKYDDIRQRISDSFRIVWAETASRRE